MFAKPAAPWPVRLPVFYLSLTGHLVRGCGGGGGGDSSAVSLPLLAQCSGLDCRRSDSDSHRQAHMSV